MEEALIKRVMPHDEEAESSVIGAMLLDNEAIMVASEMITGEDFYQKQMGLVYDTMVELYNAGKPVEPVILHTSLREKGIPEEMCGVDQILRWMDQVTTSANIKYYAEIVAEKSVARRSIRMLEENANTLYMGSEKLEDTLADLEKKSFRSGSERKRKRVCTDSSGRDQRHEKNRRGFQDQRPRNRTGDRIYGSGL